MYIYIYIYIYTYTHTLYDNTSITGQTKTAPTNGNKDSDRPVRLLLLVVVVTPRVCCGRGPTGVSPG